MYLIRNAAGQRRYPRGTNRSCIPSIGGALNNNSRFQTSILRPRCSRHTSLARSFFQTLASFFGLAPSPPGRITQVSHKSLACISYLIFGEFPFPDPCSYLNGGYSNRVNHWLVMITFLQHTDPLLPHYRSEEFTFPRGALATLDRNLLGDLGSFMGWIGATATHGISETHVAHHVSSKIPHYNACVSLLLVLHIRLTNRTAGRHLPVLRNVLLHLVSTSRAVPVDGQRFTAFSGSASLSRTMATFCSTKILKAWPLRVPLYLAMPQTTLVSNLRSNASNGWCRQCQSLFTLL